MYGVALPFSASSYNALDDGVDVYNTDVVGAD
jgi:hypothetical protein